MLHHSPAHITQALLVARSQATDPDLGNNWPAFVSSEPTVPDNAITVYDTLGHDDGRSMVDGDLDQHYGLQVRIRGMDEPTGWAKAAAIRDFLAKSVYAYTVVLESVNYRIHCFANIGTVLALGRDSPNSKRRLFTLNATLAVKEL